MRRLHTFLEREGPEVVEELAEWHSWIIRELGRHGSIGNAKELLGSSALYYSDYSGIDMPAEALRVLLPEMAQLLQCDPVRLIHTRACDKGRLQLHCLSQQSKVLHAGAMCVCSRTCGSGSTLMARNGLPSTHLCELAGM